MKEFVTVEEARRLVLDAVPVMSAEPVMLANALGRTLMVSIQSRDTIPPFDNSAMDGYAVRAADVASVPVSLRVIETIAAGTVPQHEVQPGMCARIMTGAPVPEGADAIIPIEQTTALDDASVQINATTVVGRHVRKAGEDVQVGDELFQPGQVVTPPVIGMLATLGYPEIPVATSPHVAIIATGDELVDASETPGPGQIRNSNGPALAAQVAAAGGLPIGPLVARDNPDDIAAVVDEALAADVLVFSGGVSVGQYDYVKQVLDARGLELSFWRVKQRPGKPLAFGMMHGKPVFGLPGNPVSSAMCFEQYVRPALAKMLGRQTVQAPRYRAVLEATLPKVSHLHYFARGHAWYNEDGTLCVRDTGPQGSNLYASVVRANCIMHLPVGMEAPQAGTIVEIEWLAWDS